MSEEYPRAIVREVDGQIVLEDPDAVDFIRAVEKHNCKNTYEHNLDRIIHFFCRALSAQKDPAETVVVCINAADPNGSVLADALMPESGPMWAEMIAKGQVPFARGLAPREPIQFALEHCDKQAAEKLKAIPGFAVVVFDHGVAEVWESPLPSVPEGFKVVTEDEFAAHLMSEDLDIVSQLASPYHTIWEVNHKRDQWGWTCPGWKYPGDPKTYALGPLALRER